MNNKQIAEKEMISYLNRNLDSAIEDKILTTTEAGMIFAKISYAIMHIGGAFSFSGADLSAYRRFESWCNMCLLEQSKQLDHDAMLPVNNTVH